MRATNTLVHHDFVLIALVIALATSCASMGPGSDTASYQINVTEDTARFEGPLADRVAFRATAVVRNTDSRKLYVGECMPGAEKETATSWAAVFAPMCLSGVNTLINPKDSVMFHVIELRSDTVTTGLPTGALSSGGRYRLVFKIGYGDESGELVRGSERRAISPPFVVESPVSR